MPNLPARWTAFLNTLVLAPVGTLLCLLIAYPAGLFPGAQGCPQRWRLFLLVLVIVPFWTSLLIRTYAWIYHPRRRGHPGAAGLRSASAMSR